MANNFCKYCGAALKGGYKFCDNCGAPVEEEKPTPEKETVKVDPEMVEEPYQNAFDSMGAPKPESAHPFAIASMCCGIAGLVFCWCFGSALDIVAIVFGILTLTQNKPGKTFAIVGLATGGAGLLLTILGAVFSAIFSFI